MEGERPPAAEASRRPRQRVLTLRAGDAVRVGDVVVRRVQQDVVYVITPEQLAIQLERRPERLACLDGNTPEERSVCEPSKSGWRISYGNPSVRQNPADGLKLRDGDAI